jgi:hypothetical protein
MTDMPRRIDRRRWTPQETAIQACVDAVEALGADSVLTEAVILLSAAREKVADYVDRHAMARE